jgi:hypothetical protein
MYLSTQLRTIVSVIMGICLNCQTSGLHAENLLRTVTLTDISRQERVDMGTARAWKLPEDVAFEFEGWKALDGDRIVVSGWLTNRSAEPQTVVIFPIGYFGLVALPAPGVAEKLPVPGPPMPPPAPLPPMSLILFGHSKLHLENNMALNSWRWNPDKAREIEWSFQFWNEPKPSGKFLIP